MTQPHPKRCIVCNHATFISWGVREDNLLYQCIHCELVFFYPYPTEEELKAFYNDQYHQNRGYDGSGSAGEFRQKMYRRDVLDLEKRISSFGKFLDVGCAEGAFLSSLSPKWEKFGIDISKEAVAKANSKGNITAYNKDINDLNDQAFDVIHLRGVFEHLLNPLSFIKAASKKLHSDGYLILSNTPNTGGLVPKLFRGRFKLVLPNEHLNYFSVKTIKILLHEGGLTLVHISYPYFGSPYCSFFKNCLEIPFNYLTGKMSPPFYGNIFTIYAKKND
jgi:SAM-dependent methyltransferase